MDEWAHGETDPQGMEILDREQCRDLVATEPLGRIGFCRPDGVPTILPVNHVVDAWTVAFLTTFGAKLSAVLLERPVVFEVDGRDAATRTGWSVLVRGPAQYVTDWETVQRLESLGLDVWADSVQRRRWIRIEMEELSGRRIRMDDTRAHRHGRQ